MEPSRPLDGPVPTLVTGHVDAGGDRDVFSVELQQGRQYSIEFEVTDGAMDPGVDGLVWARFVVNGPSLLAFATGGGVPLPGPNADSRAFTPDESGTYWIAIDSVGAQDPSFDFSLRVRDLGEFLPPLEIATLNPAPAVLSPGAPLAIDALPGWWPNWVQIGLDPGQSMLVTVEREGTAAEPSAAVGDYGTRIYASSMSDQHFWTGYRLNESGPTRFVLASDQGELFGLSLGISSNWSSELDPGTRLVFRLEPAPADDHGNVRAHATPMQIGETVLFRNELPGDIDWFRVDLRAGDVIAAMVENQSGADVAEYSLLKLDDGASSAASAWWGIGSSPMQWSADEDGTVFIGVRGANFDPDPLSGVGGAGGTQRLTVQRMPEDARRVLDDFAFELTLGAPHHGELTPWVQDRAYPLWLEGGQRYLLHLATAEAGWWAYSESFDQSWGSWLPDLKGQRETHTGDWIIAPQTSGWVWFDIYQGRWSSFSERQPYEISIEPLPADDHGDTPARATPISEWQTALARLDSSDTDVLALDLVAGQRYALHLIGDRVPVDAEVVLTDPQGQWTDIWFNLSTEDEEQLFEVTQTGPYLLTLRADGVLATVSYNRMGADDHGDSWLTATPIRVTEPSMDRADAGTHDGVFLMGLAGLGTPASAPPEGP